MKTRFWNVTEHIFAAIGAGAVLSGLVFYVYLQRHAMDPVQPRELGERARGPAVLIATQGSPYKNAVVGTLTQHLQAAPSYVRVIDVSQLTSVDEREWDALVVLHSWERWQPPPAVQGFVERLKDRNKLVVLTTSGSGSSRMACVDAVTSASELSRARDDGDELLGRIERVLGSAGSAAGPEKPTGATPTTRSHMLSHYADTADMRRALAAGRLDEFRAAAAAVAAQDWPARPGGDQQTYVAAVRATARAAQAASSIAGGAAELGKLGQVCASCHLEVNRPESPIAPEQPTEAADPLMSAHGIATDRLWAGLVLPSDMSWSSGMQVLLEAPSLDSPIADVAASARALRELARTGAQAEVAERGRVFGEVLSTCAGCHARLGIPAAAR